MKHYRLTQEAFGQRIGKSKGYISLLISDKEPITAGVLEGLIAGFAQLNISWLMTGEGEMLMPKSNVVEEPAVRYEAIKDDPLGALRALLDEHERRIAKLEAEIREVKAGMSKN